MTVKELIERLEEIENKSYPVEIHDPYGEEEDDWQLNADEPVRVIPRRCVAIQLGQRVTTEVDS